MENESGRPSRLGKRGPILRLPRRRARAAGRPRRLGLVYWGAAGRLERVRGDHFEGLPTYLTLRSFRCFNRVFFYREHEGRDRDNLVKVEQDTKRYLEVQVY